MRGCVSVVGVASMELISGEVGSAIGIDLASVNAAPVDEFGGLYDDLINTMAFCLKALELRLHAAQPMLIVGLEVWVD